MSYRANWSECESVIRVIADLVKASDFGDCRVQVEKITQTLCDQLHVANRHLRIERSNADIIRAEAEIAAARANIEQLMRGEE